MQGDDGRYTGPAGILFTEVELRQLFALLNGGSSPIRSALAERIHGYLIYLDATRRIERYADGLDYRQMPDPTPAQRKAVAMLKETYGRKNVKEHAANEVTGHVRVELKCEAGIWNWFYDRNGLYKDGSLTQRLFEPEPPPHTPGNALDN